MAKAFISKMAINFLSSIVDMTSIFTALLLYLPSNLLFNPVLVKIPLPAEGPASYTFDQNGGGPYTGLSDGRIVKYQGFDFVNYAFTSPYWFRALCPNNTDLGDICGRPIGVRFYDKTGELYIADAYRGLYVAGPGGGLARHLVSSAEGGPFRLLEGLDVDQVTGMVYFTDASATYNLSQLSLIISTGDATGRLMKYDPYTKQVTVLLSGLGGAASCILSEDRSFLLVTEFNRKRIQKYWLTGPKENTAEVFLTFEGNTAKMTRTVRGDFWVAINNQTDTTPILMGQRFNGNGSILEGVTFTPQYNTTIITEVHEHGRALLLGTLYVDYVGVFLRGSQESSSTTLDKFDA